MPSKRFPVLPVIVASSAAAGGVLGAFVAVGLLTIPGMHGGDGKVATPSVEQVKAAAPAETTGSATPSDNVAAAGCDQQTWPYLSQPCREELQRKNKNVRVITTDRLDQPTVEAIEAPKPAAPAQPAAGSKTETTAAVQPAAPSTVTPPGATPAKSLPVATSEPWFKPEAPAAQQMQTATPQATPSQPAPQPESAKAVAAQGEIKAKPTQDEVKAAQDEVKAQPKPERVAKKAKRKPKESPQRNLDDSGQSTVASSDDDDRPDNRAGRSSKQQRRIVERWTERDYGPSENSGQRRMVIRRSGGFFENLFGMGRGEDD